MLSGEVHDAVTSFEYGALAAASRSRFNDAQRLSQWAVFLIESQVLNAEERMNLTRRLPDFSRKHDTAEAVVRHAARHYR